MDYIGLLTKIIKKSGLTHEEIARRCEDNGAMFNYNYISSIKHSAKIPSEDVSRAIAKVCGRHADLLVIQAYYDKSPKAFKDMFDSIIRTVKAVVLMSLAPLLDETAYNIAKQQLDEMAVGEWLEYDLSNVAKQTDDLFAELLDSDDYTKLIDKLGVGEIEDECTHIAPDDSMSPTIPEGATVYTMFVALESLKDGDFICHQKKDDEIRIRQIDFLGGTRDKMLLMPLDTQRYKKEVVDTSANRLYEKVVQVVIDFE